MDLAYRLDIQISRYPNKIEYMTKEDIEEAISIAQEFRNYAIENIGIKE